MNLAWFVRTVRCIPCGVRLLWAVVFCIGLAAPPTAAEPAEQRDYRRTVEGSMTLEDMEKGQGWSYNGEYLYALTRDVRDSTLPAGAKVVVFVPAFVVDTVFLPLALIFGLFG